MCVNWKDRGYWLTLVSLPQPWMPHKRGAITSEAPSGVHEIILASCPSPFILDSFLPRYSKKSLVNTRVWSLPGNAKCVGINVEVQYRAQFLNLGV